MELRPDQVQILVAFLITQERLLKRISLHDKENAEQALSRIYQLIAAYGRKVRELKPAAQRLMEQAIYALRDEDGAKAEIHLRKALEIQKDEPGLFNNLAVALSMQGKHDEASAIADEIPTRFPDYFFGQVIVVRKAIQANDLKTAQSVLDKMMQKQELHVTEFGALCGCQIDYMIESDKPEGAISWFEMWEQGYPDDPSLKNYEQTIAMIDVLAKLKNGFPRSRRKSKKRLN